MKKASKQAREREQKMTRPKKKNREMERHMIARTTTKASTALCGSPIDLVSSTNLDSYKAHTSSSGRKVNMCCQMSSLRRSAAIKDEEINAKQLCCAMYDTTRKHKHKLSIANNNSVNSALTSFRFLCSSSSFLLFILWHNITINHCSNTRYTHIYAYIQTFIYCIYSISSYFIIHTVLV